jgi:hypothetical protein
LQKGVTLLKKRKKYYMPALPSYAQRTATLATRKRRTNREEDFRHRLLLFRLALLNKFRCCNALEQ